MTNQKLPNECIDYIIADNVIEHLTKHDGEIALRQCFNLLKPSGKLRIATPNAREICLAYLNNDEIKLSEFRSVMTNHNLEANHFLDLIHNSFQEFGHEFGYPYDFEYLRFLLEKIGFQNIYMFETGCSFDANFLGVESRSSKTELWSQLCVEARKP